MTITTGAATGRTRSRSTGTLPRVIRHPQPTATAPTQAVLDGDYPQSWDKVIGQDRAKHQLRTACEAAKLRGTRLRHALISSGSPGIGKTTLAALCAMEMGAGYRVVSGVIKPADGRKLLKSMNDLDVLVIEEIHRMVGVSKRDAEWLLNYMENGVYVGPMGKEDVPNVTVIGTTTQASSLPQPVLDRFPLRPALTEYTEDEAASISMILADSVFKGELPLPSTDNAYDIAAAANNNPRLMRNLLQNLSDLAVVDRSVHSEEAGYDLTQVLMDAGLTRDGLDETAQRYLDVLAFEYDGEPAGAGVLKERLREPGGLEQVERILLDKGYISLSKRGRVLTADGFERARSLRGL